MRQFGNLAILCVQRKDVLLQILDGKTVVTTGKLENYTREGIQMKLLSLGAKPASSVSKNTDYLIVGENAGSKLDKARQLGVLTLTEPQFEFMSAGDVI